MNESINESMNELIKCFWNGSSAVKNILFKNDKNHPSLILELEVSTESNMFKTKQFFDTYLKEQICNKNHKEKVRVIGKIFQSSVLWMKMMVVNVESDVNLSQWFLWLQVLFNSG